MPCNLPSASGSKRLKSPDAGTSPPALLVANRAEDGAGSSCWGNSDALDKDDDADDDACAGLVLCDGPRKALDGLKLASNIIETRIVRHGEPIAAFMMPSLRLTFGPLGDSKAAARLGACSRVENDEAASAQSLDLQ